MPTPCYISITGQTQGNITAGAFTADSVGNIYVQGHEDEMLVQEFLHNVTVPTDPQSGQPAGQRAHKPFIFTVALNKAVPLMYNALASGEMLPTTELHWWRTSVEGKQEHYFTTRLTDSTIVDMKLHMPHCQDPAKRDKMTGYKRRYDCVQKAIFTLCMPVGRSRSGRYGTGSGRTHHPERGVRRQPGRTASDCAGYQYCRPV